MDWRFVELEPYVNKVSVVHLFCLLEAHSHINRINLYMFLQCLQSNYKICMSDKYRRL